MTEKVKFRVLPKVHGLKVRGIRYLPGDVVDLPASYEGESWLERVDPVPVVAAAPGVIEPVAVAEVPMAPLETSPRKRGRKMPRIFRRN